MERRYRATETESTGTRWQLSEMALFQNVSCVFTSFLFHTEMHMATVKRRRGFRKTCQSRYFVWSSTPSPLSLPFVDCCLCSHNRTLVTAKSCARVCTRRRRVSKWFSILFSLAFSFPIFIHSSIRAALFCRFLLCEKKSLLDSEDCLFRNIFIRVKAFSFTFVGFLFCCFSTIFFFSAMNRWAVIVSQIADNRFQTADLVLVTLDSSCSFVCSLTWKLRETKLLLFTFNSIDITSWAFFQFDYKIKATFS